MSEIPFTTTGPRSRWVRGFKLAMFTLVTLGIFYTVRRDWDQLSSYSWQLKPSWLVVSAVLYLLGLLPSALFWRQTLLALGGRPTWRRTLRAYFLGHLGKYVPGKVAVVVIRAGALSGNHVNPAMAAVSVFLETLTMMAVGAFISAAIVIGHFGWNNRLAWLAFVVLVVAGLPTLPPVFRALVRRMPSRWLREQDAVDLDRITVRLMLQGWLVIAFGWSLMGLSLLATLQSLGAADLRWAADWSLAADWLLATGAVALAVVVGFASLIPGGAGVRDSVLAALMIPRFGVATALTSAFVLRMVWLVSELVISAILYRVGEEADD